MIALNKEEKVFNRPNAEYILRSPFFMSVENRKNLIEKAKILSSKLFYQNKSMYWNHLEQFEERLTKKFQIIAETKKEKIVRNQFLNWGESLESDIKKEKSYVEDKAPFNLFSLFRYSRNQLAHIEENKFKPEYARIIIYFGKTQESLMTYLLKKFPWLCIAAQEFLDEFA